jgi:hypothetical protein
MGRKAGASESTLVLVLPLGPVVAEAGMPVTSATFPSFCPCNLPVMLNTSENMVKLAICAGAAHVAFAFSTVVDVVFAFGAVVNVAFAFGAGVVDVKGADDDGGEDAGEEEVDTKIVTTSVIVEGAADTVIVVVAVVVVGGSVSVCVCVCMSVTVSATGCEEGSWRE